MDELIIRNTFLNSKVTLSITEQKNNSRNLTST